MVRAYGPQLARFAVGIVGDPDEAEDIVQDVLWRIWEGRADWRPATSLRAYLFTAVRNHALNRIERGRVRARHRETTWQAAQFDLELRTTPGPSETLESAEEHAASLAALRQAFLRLTERQQSAVRLRYEHGLTCPEIATTLGISLSAAEQLVARAIRTLRAVWVPRPNRS